MINQLIYWVLDPSEIILARSLAGLAIRRIDIISSCQSGSVIFRIWLVVSSNALLAYRDMLLINA